MTDGFPGQATRPPPVADAGRVAWRSGQNRQRRTGAPDDFGYRKRGSVPGSNSTSATKKHPRTRSEDVFFLQGFALHFLILGSIINLRRDSDERMSVKYKAYKIR